MFHFKEYSLKIQRGVRAITDYKEMYFKMARAAADAVELLIAAQQEREEMYINAPEPMIELVVPKKEDE